MFMRHRLGMVFVLALGLWGARTSSAAEVQIGDPCDVLNDTCIDDGIVCTTEFCGFDANAGEDICQRINDDLACSGGAGPCFGTLSCEPNNPTANSDGCVASGNPCDDGVGCTDDVCNDLGGGNFSCTITPNDANCPDDSLFCNGTEFCDATLGCTHTGNPCQVGQVCDEANGACRDCVSDEECDDGIACNGAETCQPCVAAGCNECVPGSPPCDDGIACTVDQCDENNPDNPCSHVPNDALCPDDGNPCTTAKCDALTGCSQVQKDCDDHAECTLDACNTDTGMCEHTPQDFVCADLKFCNGAETCNPADPSADPTTGCVPGTTPECDPGFTCSLFCDSCVFCETDADCDDGDACNGREICADAFSQGCASTCTTPPTDDPCPPNPDAECVRMRCVNDGNNQFHCEGTPDNSLCDNGLACDGKEVCDPACVTAACQAAVVAGPALRTGCFPGPAPNCADTFNCTLDACKECNADICAFDGCSREDCANGYACTHTPNDGACDDDVDCTVNKCDPVNGEPATGCLFTKDDSRCDNGTFCDGKEICIGECAVAGGCSGCEAGTPVDCNDGIACTGDFCDDNLDRCVHIPRDAYCSNGIGCDGRETCVGGRCPTPVLCCLPGKGCDTAPDISECENANVAGEPSVPLCYADGCLSAMCCDPAASDCTEDPVAPAACLGSGGIPICGACESVVCCLTNGGVDCDTGISPEACVDSGRIPACGDCVVRCCFDPTVAGNGQHPGCIDNMPLDLCTFLKGRADCDGCEQGTPPDCADDLDCTVDSCIEGQKLEPYFCVHTPDDTLCDDGIFCNGAEHCVLPPPPPFVTAGFSGGCQSGPPPVCPKGTTCDACIDGCAYCLGDADCIDSDPCTVDGCVDVGGGVYQCVNKTIPGCTPPALPTTQIAQKGSLLIFSKVEIKWDNDGTLLQDTFLSVYNDDDSRPVQVQAYFINGDVPLEEVCMGNPCVQLVQEAEPGWNTADCRFTLTKSNPIYWSAARGGGNLANGGGNCQPFTVLDDSFPPGRPDPENDMRTRILRGYVILWAVDLNECVLDEPNGQYQEIRWNDLTGEALIVNYERGYAWDYRPWAFQAHGVEHGEFTGTPGVLNLDGVEYDAVFSRLLLDFQASGSQGYLQVNRDGRAGIVVTGDTDLTLHPVSADLRQDDDGPIVTKAEFSIFNEFEAKFSGTRRCIQCWEQRLLSHYTESGIPNHFNRSALGTDAGIARIEGLASTECNFLEPFFARSQAAALLGVSAKVLTFGASPSLQEEWAGTNLIGNGVAKAVIRYDLFRGSGELLRVAPAKENARTTEAQPGASRGDPPSGGGTK